MQMQMNNHSSSATDFLVWKVLFSRLVQSIWIELSRLTSSVGLNVSQVIVLLLRLLLFSISFDLVEINSFWGQTFKIGNIVATIRCHGDTTVSIYRSVCCHGGQQSVNIFTQRQDIWFKMRRKRIRLHEYSLLSFNAQKLSFFSFKFCEINCDR